MESKIRIICYVLLVIMLFLLACHLEYRMLQEEAELEYNDESIEYGDE